MISSLSSVDCTGITALCTVALIAVERLFVVCKPLGTITFQSKHAAGGLVLSWLWSLIWNTPPLFGWGSYQLEGVGTSCGPDWQSRDFKNMSYIICYFSLCFAVPFVIIVVSYSWLLYTLRQVKLCFFFCYLSDELMKFSLLFSVVDTTVTKYIHFIGVVKFFKYLYLIRVAYFILGNVYFYFITFYRIMPYFLLQFIKT